MFKLEPSIRRSDAFAEVAGCGEACGSRKISVSVVGSSSDWRRLALGVDELAVLRRRSEMQGHSET